MGGKTDSIGGLTMDAWDRELESEMETLCDDIKSPWEARILSAILPVIRRELELVQDAYQKGGREEVEIEQSGH